MSLHRATTTYSVMPLLLRQNVAGLLEYGREYAAISANIYEDCALLRVEPARQSTYNARLKAMEKFPRK